MPRNSSVYPTQTGFQEVGASQPHRDDSPTPTLPQREEAAKSRRDDTLLTVDFNLRRKRKDVHALQSPAGTTQITGTWETLAKIAVLMFCCFASLAAEAQTNLNKKLVLKLVNQHRTTGCSCGGIYYAPTTRIVWNKKLAQAALDHSLDMNKNHFFSHTGSDRSDVGTRAKRRNYQWQMVGENISMGNKT